MNEDAPLKNSQSQNLSSHVSPQLPSATTGLSSLPLPTEDLSEMFRQASDDPRLIEILEKEFLSWSKREGHSPKDNEHFSTYLSWARASGLQFTSDVFSVLSLVFESVQSREWREHLKKLLAIDAPSDFKWTEFYRHQREVELDESRYKHEKDVETFHRKEPEVEQDRRRRQIASAIVFGAQSKDSALVKDLDWLLTTNNLPPGEAHSVMEFLARITSLQADRILPKTEVPLQPRKTTT